jgi:hypothetical protein
LHVQFQLRTSDDLEIYELDDASKDKLEDICDLRQPVIFDFEKTSSITSVCCKDKLSLNYPAFELKVRTVKSSTDSKESGKDCNYLPLPWTDAIKLFDEDKNASYYSENNSDFLKETGTVKVIQQHDDYLRPYMVSNCYYDIMLGSEKVTTPLRYEINYRNYFTVAQGTVRIKLTPPKNTKYLEPIYDYENFEFRSNIDSWSKDVDSSQTKYKFLHVTLTAGKTIYIPAYWWYSIEFEKNTSLVCCRYRTYMNNVAIVPNMIMCVLQRQNITLKGGLRQPASLPASSSP